ncbi:MAG TPA: UvrD-helicase domain-containing protein [Bacteroidales bacterium]|nr:UvrD-helicase domain-containing protein [Bacteroidales bacterium]HOC87847.1 UvrD-helicase domain-containing protein [Prolixibacteraceae bacterium]MDD3521644.1 UvrD-helicase domain-containing protein [Bacteroidales bacterium]MDD4436133.1 UvrD-helicase domain-containing protein [Bacteroidales bacterium]MDD5732620.1 UvrD-helicase domain-containing protein [Bacteroidales bacterium]
MFGTFIYNDIKPGKLRKQFDKTVEQLSNGDFASAGVKKMTDTGYYRARLDYENRLLFRFGQFNDQTCLLILEIILNHAYGKSRFLRGIEVDESKLTAISDQQEIPTGDFVPLAYVNHRRRRFHLLDKVLSFDDSQDEILTLPLPHIIIGTAGSGKTALTLEKMKSMTGRILYITLSPFLAENAARLFYSFNYENDKLEIDFLSYREFIETLMIPKGKELDFSTFESWFARHRQASRLSDGHKTFEEFRGVITGYDITKEYLSFENYLSLGVKQSIFLANEREAVYRLFEKYLIFLKENGCYDINILTHQWLPYCKPVYDYIVVDEVQDFTNIQLHIILKSLKTPSNFILCGDSNQVVYPNFFSWSHLKSMFYQSERKENEIKILHTNYRNSQTISNLANRLLKIKNARFGSIDKESNYLLSIINEVKGDVVFIDHKVNDVADLGRKTRLSVKYAVLVLRNEDKAKAREFFQTPLLFSVQELKGLEYENIILYNFISDNAAEYNAVCEGVTHDNLLVDELTYARGKDKTDKSLDVYKFYINSLYVAVTRAVKNVYIVEKARGHKLLRLLEIAEDAPARSLKEEISSTDDWKQEARRLEMQGKAEQVDAIRKGILATGKPDWEPMTREQYRITKIEALNPDNFNKKAKDRLFDFALLHNQELVIHQLADLNYKRAERYETERSSLYRKYYQHYREDNLTMIIPLLNKYGVDFRDVHNFTPLHAAAFAGAVNIAKTLLSHGANPALQDTFRKTPLQIALEQAFLSADYARNKLGKMYPLLLADAMKIQTDGYLIKIDSHKVEYLLINLFIVVQPMILQKKLFHEEMGVKVDDLIENMQHFSDAVLPPHRKKRQYLLSLLAKHEIDSANPYNKKIFKRISRGNYQLNPGLSVLIDEQWISVADIFNSRDLSEVEIREHARQREVKEMEAYRKKVERKIKQRDKWRW